MHYHKTKQVIRAVTYEKYMLSYVHHSGNILPTKLTSTPVIRTIIPTCRSPSPPAVASLSHGPRDCPASLSHLANDHPMHNRFFTFWPGANPWAKVHRKGRRSGGLRDLPPCKISSLYDNPRPRYLLPKCCGQNDKQTKMIYPQHTYRHVGITN